MNLNKIGFWAVSATALMVGFVMAVENFSSAGFLSGSSKCQLMIWGMVFVAMFVSLKLISVFDRINTQIGSLKEELENAKWQISINEIEKATEDSVVSPRSMGRLSTAAAGAGGKVVPFRMRSLHRKGA
jgi:hypothetical protein